jgi:hypothetical protein
MITGWFFGFTPPWRDVHGIFGHVEAWGCDADGSWVFVDPRSTGLQIAVAYRYEDIEDLLAMQNERCSEILWMPQVIDKFQFPVHGPMSCASICGSLVGIRALFPWTLRRKLLAKGAEVVHGKAKGRESGGSRGATA